MDVEIRPVTGGDVDRLCDLTRASIRELADESYEDRQISAWIDAVDPDLYPITAEGTDVRVAELDAGIVGVGWLTHDPGDYYAASVDGELTGIYIHPEFAGRGVGTALYERLETLATQANIDALGLWASRNATEFYEQHGYSSVTEQVVTYGEVEVPVVEMRKSLTE